MLAKRTSKNQITLPKRVADHFPDTDYFEVREEASRIVLVPVHPGRADAVRRKLATLGIRPSDVPRAVRWARRK